MGRMEGENRNRESALQEQRRHGDMMVEGIARPAGLWVFASVSFSERKAKFVAVSDIHVAVVLNVLTMNIVNQRVSARGGSEGVFQAGVGP